MSRSKGASAPDRRGTRSGGDWRALFEQASEGIFIADVHGRYTQVNSAGCQMLGRARHEIVGHAIRDFLHPEDVPRLQETRERLLRGGVDTAEWRLRNADGTWLEVEVSAKILPDGRWQAFARDVTERNRIQAALASSEARYRQIVSMADEGIVCIDHQQRITLVNHGAERLFGWPAAELLGKPLSVLLPARFGTVHEGYVDAFGRGPAQAREMSSRGPVRGLRRNGDEFPAHVSISVHLEHGLPVYTAVIRDISRETRLLRQERMLSDISAILASSLDVDVILELLVKTAVRGLTDLCVVEVEMAPGNRRLRVGACDALGAELAKRMEADFLAAQAPRWVSEVWSSRAPALVRSVSPDDLSAHCASEKQRELLRALGPCSLVTVPILLRARLFGVLTWLCAGRQYDDHDLDIAAAVAERSATALDMAVTHQALVEAHAAIGAQVAQLLDAQAQIRSLKGLLPICAWCGNIRDDERGGIWRRLDEYVAARSGVEVSHGICPACGERALASGTSDKPGA